MKHKDFVVGDFVEWNGFYYIIDADDHTISKAGGGIPSADEAFVMSVSPRSGIIVNIEERGIVAVSDHETILLPKPHSSQPGHNTTQISLLSRAS